MKILVTPGPNGLISYAGEIVGQPISDTAVIVNVDSMSLPPSSAARVTEAGLVEIVANHVGSGPWFDQQASTVDRLTPIEITELGVAPAATWAMTPRAETTAERRAREAAETEALAASETVRKANRVVSAVQIRLAASEAGVREAIETMVAAPETPQVVKDYWEYSTEYRRAHPVWAAALPLLNATEADIDALFDVAETK